MAMDGQGLTAREVHALEQALHDPAFRDLLVEYCKEVSHPDKVAERQRELVALEKQRGVRLTFINPTPGYVIKTSLAGDRKVFLNVCSGEELDRPAVQRSSSAGVPGLSWSLPYSVAPERTDLDKNNVKCVVFDVVFHPHTLLLAEKNAVFKKMLDGVVCDAVESFSKMKLDRKNLKFPKMNYKGVPAAAVTRKPDPDFDPKAESAVDPALLDLLYPQKSHPEPSAEKRGTDYEANVTPDGYAIPKYSVIHRKEFEMREHTYARDAKSFAAVPTALVVEVKLPLLSSSDDVFLDVRGKKFSLVSDRPARYRLDLDLPYAVDDDAGSAKFDLSERVLRVTLPVVRSETPYLREDSGVESDVNSPCVSDEDSRNSSDAPNVDASEGSEPRRTSPPDESKSSEVSYRFPDYTCNSLDDVLAVTFHVERVKPDSAKAELLPSGDGFRVKFSSIAAGYFVTDYAAFLRFPPGIGFAEPEIEVWDNNVVMQIEVRNSMPDRFLIGPDESSLTERGLGESRRIEEPKTEAEEAIRPSIEVSARGRNEINISLSRVDDSEPANETETEEVANPIPKRTNASDDGEIASEGGSFKGILKFRSPRIGRSFSESSVDFVDYIASPSFSVSSADCIPEEESSSLKKTVRFSDTIAKQTFRSNSSILGQKNKNQKKKQKKKRAQERRASEGDPDDGSMENIDEKNNIKNKFLKSPNKNINGKRAKQRRDSGLTDTDDADTEKDDDCATPSKSYISKFFEREHINKGKYADVSFKNDLIFDLDM